ncbi:MAG TPA: histone deacetylase [Solirubrobacteraceae bacterium]|nr:histone deacetylase [Solirubrobacteraceae bacterium]
MSPAPVFLSHPSSLQHDTGPHPEQPARISAVEAGMAQNDWVGYERVASPPAAIADLTAVHPAEHVEMIEAAARAGGAQIDADTVVSAGSYTAARHAAGGAVALVDGLLDGPFAPGSFSAHRPPGHHAERARAMGFCLFNNVAVAATHALGRGLERVMIVDWDVHHGNGTEAIFEADPRVLFVSIHQSPLYPGTGAAGFRGIRDGAGYTVNLPVAAGAGDATFTALVQGVCVPLARAYRPQLLLVSAGFDAHREDPLADCMVTESGYATMGATLRDVCAELGVPFGGLLEGGYALDALGRSVVATLTAFSGIPDAVAEPDAALAVPEVAQARRGLAQHWPAL